MRDASKTGKTRPGWPNGKTDRHNGRSHLLHHPRSRLCREPTDGPGGGTGGSPATAGLIDDIVASGTKTGFRHIYAALLPDALGRPQAFTLNADPIRYGVTGQRYFFTDPSAVIRQNASAQASATDPPL